MLKTAGKIIDIHHSYDGEVICGLVELSPSDEQAITNKKADIYFSSISHSIHQIRQDLNEIIESGKSVAICRVSVDLGHQGELCQLCQCLSKSTHLESDQNIIKKPLGEGHKVKECQLSRSSNCKAAGTDYA